MNEINSWHKSAFLTFQSEKAYGFHTSKFHAFSTQIQTHPKFIFMSLLSLVKPNYKTSS